MKKTDTIDQTNFANQEPIYEEPADYDEIRKSLSFFKTKKGKMISILAALFGFFLSLIIILFFVFNKKPLDLVEKEKEPSQEIIQLDPLRTRIKVLADDLDQADPTKQELPFPPVDLSIRID
jgi:hypothetical protein